MLIFTQSSAFLSHKKLQKSILFHPSSNAPPHLFLPSSSSLALTVRMVEPTSASSSTSTSYADCENTGLLSFTSLMKMRTYAVSDESKTHTHTRLFNHSAVFISSACAFKCFLFCFPVSLSPVSLSLEQSFSSFQFQVSCVSFIVCLSSSCIYLCGSVLCLKLSDEE